MRLVIGVLIAAAALPASAQDKPAERQIREAVSALPASLRDAAAVLGYRNGSLTRLQPGSNGLVCLADDPAREGFHVACYHESLEPFMARGRSLRANGITERSAIDSIRAAEIEAGRLAMPDHPAALYSWSADSDALTDGGDPVQARGLYVLYVPYGTEASTGVAEAPARDRPWLMNAGRPWAHVMIGRRTGS